MRAVIVYPRVGLHASRILKEAECLVNDQGISEVLILSMFYDNTLPTTQIVNDRIKIRRLKTWTYSLPKNSVGDSIKFIEFIFYTLIAFGWMRPKYIIPHSLSVLPIGVIFKKVFGSTLIYNAHELETERTGLKGRRQQISKMLERVLIKYVDRIIVVSSSIQKWYLAEYNVLEGRIFVIRNVPAILTMPNEKSNYFQKTFNLPKDNITFIYQGVLGDGRGVEFLIETFSQLSTTNKHLIFLGFGPKSKFVKAAAKKHKNIHFHDAVLPSEIKGITSSADVGLSLIENYSLSYYFCLPNKLFEYIASGLPIICSDFPDMSEVVHRYKVGWTVPINADSFITLLNQIDIKAIQEKRNNCSNVIHDINWAKEKEIYNEILRTS